MAQINGKTQQDSSTSDLIFRIAFLISYISEFMTLLPGDVISTGTPEGVGLGQNPPRYLREGDVVEFGIDGLGTANSACGRLPEEELDCFQVLRRCVLQPRVGVPRVTRRLTARPSARKCSHLAELAAALIGRLSSGKSLCGYATNSERPPAIQEILKKCATAMSLWRLGQTFSNHLLPC